MKNDKIFVFRKKKYGGDRQKMADEGVAFGIKIDTDFVLERMENGRLSTIHSYLFQKYGFEFVREIKKLLNSKIE